MTPALALALYHIELRLTHQGWEFPDACSRAATDFSIPYDDLRRAYDKQFEGVKYERAD